MSQSLAWLRALGRAQGRHPAGPLHPHPVEQREARQHCRVRRRAWSLGADASAPAKCRVAGLRSALRSQRRALGLAAASPAPTKATSAGKASGASTRSSSVPDFVCGAGAAFVNILVTYPANKLMFRQQVDGLALPEALASMRADGLHGLYRGVAPPLLQKTVSLSLMFGLYAWYCQRLEQSDLDSTFVTPVAAMLAGSTEALLTPFERVQTLLQLPAHSRAHHNTVHVARELAPHGIREFYRGVAPIIFRNSLSSAFFFTLREPIADLLPGQSEACTFCDTLRSFVSGAVLGAVISTVFFPVNVAKSVLQRRVGGEHRRVLPTLRMIMRHRQGFGGLYRGVNVNFARALISWGVINAGYETLMGWAIAQGWASQKEPSEWVLQDVPAADLEVVVEHTLASAVGQGQGQARGPAESTQE